jgi:IrrE N-terminal-like domain
MRRHAFNVNRERPCPFRNIARRNGRTYPTLGVSNTLRAQKVGSDRCLYGEVDVLWDVVSGTRHPQGIKLCYYGLDPDILGAMFFSEARIVIDESLDPEENPSKEGRYRFTLAHEGGGHWRLHRWLFANDPAQALLFGGQAIPSVICRSSQAKERVEWQADFYASCLLMPRKLVMTAWDEMFSDRKRRVLQPRIPINHPFVEVPRNDRRIGNIDLPEADDKVLDRIARPLAGRFLVSTIAMRIRLEKLGLLLREIPHQRTLVDGE